MEKFRSALLKNKTFPLLTALLCAAAFAGGHMFVKYGYGLFNEIAQAEMVRNGLDTGDFATPIGYCTGFLLARVMKGPLVGILDIGGSIMTGIGTGMVSLAKSVGLDILVDSFPLALLTGCLLGLVIGFVMGAGNAAGRWLAPLIILSAVSYSIPAGIGAVIGSYIFLKLEKPMVGGTILGAIILAMIFPK